MADNVVSNPGAGGATFRSDDVGGGIQVPFAKLMDGTDGSSAIIPGDATNGLFVNVKAAALPTGAATEATLAAASAKLPATLGQKAMAASMAVAIASDQSAVPVSVASLPLPSGAATETTLAALNTKTATAKTSDYDTGGGTDTVPMMGIALPASGGAVQGGTATNPVRTDPTGTTAQPVTDNSGSLTVDNGGTFAVQAAQSGTWTVQPGNTANTTAWKVDASSVAIPVTDNSGSLTTDSAQLPAALGQTTMANSLPVVLASNQTSIPVAATLSAETTKVIGTINVAAAQTIATTNAGTFAVQAGQAAHDAAVAGNPVRVAGRAGTADYTAVADGDTADLLATILGKQVVQPYALPANTWSYAAAAAGLVTTTGVSAKAAAGSGIRNYITSIQVINSHATISTEILVNDGAAGTTLHRGWAQAVGGGYACKFDPPLRGTANTLVEIKEGTTTATTGVYVNLQGYAAAE